MPYNVLIAEEMEMPRRLLEILISSCTDFRLLCSVPDAAAALSVCRTEPVDLVLMDAMTVFGHIGPGAAEKIRKEFPEIRIIILTSVPEFSWPARARRAGADSFLYTDGGLEELPDLMRRTMAGERIYPAGTPQVCIGRTTNHAFTERELDVLKELTAGDSNAAIAGRLHISPGTVKIHVQHMLKKTGLRNRTELACEARGLGIVIRQRDLSEREDEPCEEL